MIAAACTSPDGRHCSCLEHWELDTCCRCGDSYTADRREATTSPMPAAEAGSVGTSFTVPGPPTGKARPRMTRRGRVYTPAATMAAEEAVRLAWAKAGGARIEGLVAMTVVAVHARPPSHYLRDGVSLSAAGRRATPRSQKPDLDNVLKLVADALNGHAYEDDCQIARAVLLRREAAPGEPPHVFVHLTQENA